MNTKQELLLSFFSLAAAREPALMKMIMEEPAFTVDHKSWRFDLQQLHRFLQIYNADFGDIDYRAFRKLLYQCPVNEKLRPSGAQVVISDNQSHVDASTYALVWNDTTVEKDFSS